VTGVNNNAVGNGSDLHRERRYLSHV
jgi:hypothetical protein